MTPAADPRPTPTDRRARAAVAALFLANGAVFANILPRYPEIKAALHLTNSVYGLAVAAFPVGAITAGLAAAPLIRRFGSAKVAVAGMVFTSLCLLAAGLAPTALLFAFGLFVAGAFDSLTDVGQNAHGLRVQRRYGRSILNSFHAVWSIGAVLGGAMAAGAIALHLPIGTHLALSAALCSAASIVALRFCLPGRDDADAVPGTRETRGAVDSRVRPHLILTMAALVVIAMAGTIVEDAGSSWAALYLGSLGAPAAVAAAGFIALMGAQFVGRLIGDRLVDRFGQRGVARSGGLIAAVGMGTALALPNVPCTLLGFAAAGFGVATLVPAALHAADELPGLRRGTGLTIVSWLMRLGFMLSPPLVGALADATSLRAGLLITPVVCMLVALLAGVLAGRHGRSGRPET